MIALWDANGASYEPQTTSLASLRASKSAVGPTKCQRYTGRSSCLGGECVRRKNLAYLVAEGRPVVLATGCVHSGTEKLGMIGVELSLPLGLGIGGILSREKL